MLSQDLRNLEVWFEDVYEGRSDFSVEGCKNFLRVLKSSTEQAKILEQQEFLPNVGRLEEKHLLKGNVVQLPIVARSIPRQENKNDGSVA